MSRAVGAAYNVRCAGSESCMWDRGHSMLGVGERDAF